MAPHFRQRWQLSVRVRGILAAGRACARGTGTQPCRALEMETGEIGSDFARSSGEELLLGTVGAWRRHGTHCNTLHQVNTSVTGQCREKTSIDW